MGVCQISQKSASMLTTCVKRFTKYWGFYFAKLGGNVLAAHNQSCGKLSNEGYIVELYLE